VTAQLLCVGEFEVWVISVSDIRQQMTWCVASCHLAADTQQAARQRWQNDTSHSGVHYISLQTSHSEYSSDQPVLIAV